MVRQRVRRVGNSLVVTLPAEELERLGIAEGDLIAFEPRKIETTEHFVMSPEVRAAVATFWDRPDFQEGLAYLKDHRDGPGALFADHGCHRAQRGGAWATERAG